MGHMKSEGKEQYSQSTKHDSEANQKQIKSKATQYSWP